jgi:hypothetical protein
VNSGFHLTIKLTAAFSFSFLQSGPILFTLIIQWLVFSFTKLNIAYMFYKVCCFIAFIAITTSFKCARKLYIITGVVTSTKTYCGGAAPSNDILQQYRTPQPIGGKLLYIKKGAENKKKAKIIGKFKSNADGTFTVKLPAGTYCIVEESKAQEFKAPADNKEHEWNKQCLLEAWAQCDYQLVVTNKNISEVKINYHTDCFYSMPCCKYKGAFPPQ